MCPYPAPPTQASPPVARLALSQLRRMRRIVDAAVGLAGVGGFEAVRLRDVAEQSDVALGTLYKYFRSKEDILLFAFGETLDDLERVVVARPPRGGTARERVANLFRRATRGALQRPPLGRALIRAMTSGDPETAPKIAASNLRLIRLIVAAVRDEAPDVSAPLESAPGNVREAEVGDALLGVWFSALVGWSAGLFSEAEVGDKVARAARLMLPLLADAEPTNTSQGGSDGE